MKKLLAILTLLAITGAAYAQNIEFTKENFKGKKDELKVAKENIEQGDLLYLDPYPKYQQALDFYLKANDFNPNNAKLNYKIGVCYLHSSFKTKALPYLEKAEKLDPLVDPEEQFNLAWADQLTMKWEEAIKHYNMYKQSLKGKDIAEKLELTDKRIQECKNGIELTKKPVRVFIDNLGNTVNSKYFDYTPVISADEDVLYFTSRRDNSTGQKLDFEGEYFEDIFVSYKFGRKWTSAQNLGKPINTDGHDATIGVSPDGQKLFIYKDDKGDGNIYECNLEGDKWSEPKKMQSPVNSKAHESSASLSYDGKKLFFVSQREGGFGSRDIYMATMDAKGKWSKVENLGPGINTKWGEEGAFIMPDGKTLYFSSQGHKTMGGYDIFKTTFENGKWSEPENLGYPVNSPDDDVFFVINASGKRGYYSSIKEDGFGGRDLYMITFLGVEKPLMLNTEDNLIASQAAPISEIAVASQVEIKSAALTLLKGVIRDAVTLKPLEAQIDLIDLAKNEEIASFKSNSKTGKYLVSLPAGMNYGIAVKADGYLFHSENFNIPASAGYQEIVKDVDLKNIAVGSKIILKNIFFDTDKWTLKPESTSELERLVKLMNDVPTLKIEIAGHTDNRASMQHNQTLSENRAKAVVDYLVAKGISKDRMTSKGYSYTKPIATNDTDAGRAQNRRTEFEIISQ